MLADPADLGGFTDLIATVLDDDNLAQRLGDAAGTGCATSTSATGT